MQKMDEEILRAEESDLMQRYDVSIRRAEQQLQQHHQDEEEEEAKNGPKPFRTKKPTPLPLLPLVMSTRPPSPWLVVAEQMRNAHARRIARVDAAACCYYDLSSVEGLEYVVATKLIPRRLGTRWKTRKHLEDYFVRKFQRDLKQQQQQLRDDPMFWKGFRLRLCSANPSAWRLHVYGYRTTVDAFLLCLAGIFGKALRKQQQQEEENAPLIVKQPGNDAALAE